MIIHKVEERRCTRRRVPSSFSHKEETRPLFVPARRDKKQPSKLGCGRRTDARLGHGVVTTHSG
ncbi:hypothetical protein [Aneurinibacillus aneurinilyticus]|uniref:hypothetical protein n=1 Tax=Aneurinibacillus aneurinilyticus TaxID=1391 RepID=UPI00352431B1